MRVIEQNLTVVTADPNGFSVSDTDVTGPFPLDLVLGGVLASTNPYNGAVEIDLSANSFGVLVGFTTGLTGSVADVTITGRDINGNPLVEVVTMPGASGAVSSVNVFSFIESLSIDAAYTNLEVGIIETDTQYARWVFFDHYQNGMEVMLDLEEIVDGGTINVDLTTDHKFMRSGNPEPDSVFAADAPAADAIISTQAVLSQVPVIAARIKNTAGTAGQWRARFLQSGGGNR